MRSKFLRCSLLPAALLACTIGLVGCSGDDGSNGTNGLSAYQIAVANGFVGTEAEWLSSLQGASSPDTAAASQLATAEAAGYTGTQAQLLTDSYTDAQTRGYTGTSAEWTALQTAADTALTNATLVAAQGVSPESCATCHNGTVVRSGASHQAEYSQLFQEGVVTVSNLTYVFGGGNHTVSFKLSKNGADLDCTTLTGTVGSLNIGYSEYTAGATPDAGEFTAPDTQTSSTDATLDGYGDRISLKGTVTYTAATNTCTSVIADSFGASNTALGDLTLMDGILVVYGEDELVSTGPAGSHLQLAKYPFAALQKMETAPGAIDYVSDANATGCEKCHQKPYYKHGYIIGDVGQGVGDLDFYTCKICHIDNGKGGHNSWQYSVDDPQGWANGDPETADYTYKTMLMNDVHMSHAMEFPYPQSMRNCDTCHHGKLTETLATANMTLTTCKSCHPVTGGTDLPDGNGNFAYDTRGMALDTLIPHTFDNTTVCADCHKVGGIAPLFSEIHTGYNPLIYDEATGAKYADGITASIDSVTVSGNTLDIKISAAGTVGSLAATSITPTIMVSFYGYDTKDFLVSNHTRDDNNLRMEKTIGTDNALFTEVDGDGTTDGTWEVTLDMSAYAATPSIPAMIADGTIKKAEVAFRPALKNAANNTVGLNAVTKTVDVTADAVDPFVANYFQGTNALVSVTGDNTINPNYAGTKGCNSCHDQLATTFHSGDRGGSIVVCRMCHVVTSGGSHLEGQSRSIDSYVHAIHRFQAFDVDNVDFTDPVEAAKYQEHIEFLFPDFATINCEACHTNERAVDNGTRVAYDVPDQSKSMPGVLSGTDEISGVVPATTPSVVVGPAARACGACHRAEDLNEDGAGEYIALNQHMESFGYRLQAKTGVIDTVIKTIMSMFQ